MIDAALENNQIRWIITDSAVYAFYMQILTDLFSSLDPVLLDNAIELLGLQPDDEDHPEAENT